MVLAAETIEREVFPGLQLNGIVDVSFSGFIKVVDTLGCAYVNVDHRYYNQNVGSTETDYTSINLQPGYQKLCYENALDYVRYRHTDSDFVRVARQQDFLRDLRQQVSPGNEIGQIDTVAKAVGHAISSTFQASASELIELAKLIAFSQAKPLRQVKFRTSNVEYQFGGGSYVTDHPRAHEQATIEDFLNGHEQPRAPAPKPPAHASRHGHHALHRLVARARPVPQLPRRRERSGEGRPQRPLPRALPGPPDRTGRTAEGASVCARRPAGPPPPRLRRRLARRTSIGGYYDFQGTDWLNPPLFAHARVAVDRRALIPAGRRRLAHSRHRLALGPGALLADEHAAGGTLQRADDRDRPVGPAASLSASRPPSPAGPAREQTALSASLSRA